MSRSTRAQNWKGVTLEAQEIDLAHAEEAWIVRPVWRVATGAPFRLHRDVFIHKRPFLVGMTLGANCISAGQSSDLSQCGCAVDIVAIAAMNEAFIDPMVIGFSEIRLSRGVTSIAEVGLYTGQQVL